MSESKPLRVAVVGGGGLSVTPPGADPKAAEWGIWRQRILTIRNTWAHRHSRTLARSGNHPGDPEGRQPRLDRLRAGRESAQSCSLALGEAY